jgi:uncharacterized protein
LIIKVDKRKNYGEKRWISIGLLGDIIVVMIFTLRGKTIRIISVRKANHEERRMYYERTR